MGDKPGIIHRRWFQVLLAVIGLLVLISAFSDTPSGQDAAGQTSPASSSAADTGEEAPASLEAAIGELLQGQTTYGLPRLQSVDVEDKAGGQVVWVYFNADENLTTGLTRSGIEIDMGELYRAIYTFPGASVKSANLLASYPLVDQFGNESQDVVYSTTMKASVASQVNWDSDLVDFTQLWTTWILHPALQD